MSFNLLIVDDSAIVRSVLKKTIAITDLDIGTILEAGNGEEALEVLKSNWVDLIFLDINMPKMNGMEFMSRLRNDEKLESTPVIVVSTEGSKERKDELFGHDIKAYLRKPVTAEQLTQTVKQVLGGGEPV